MKFQLDKKIRSVIQVHSRHGSYIFSGSKKSFWRKYSMTKAVHFTALLNTCAYPI